MAVTFGNPSIYGGQNPVYGAEFSGNGQPINQGLLQTQQAARYSANPVYRATFYHELYKSFGIFEWLEENMGYKTMCEDKYKLAHFFPAKEYFNLQNATAITIPASVNGAPATGTIIWPASETYFNGTYLLPTVKGSLAVAPLGQILEISAIAPAAGNTFSITVVNRHYPNPIVIPANSDVKVFTTQELADCACPTGVISMEQGPLTEDIELIQFATPSDEICGKALYKCQNLLFQWTATDADGCIRTYQHWYDAFYQKMLVKHRQNKKMRILNDPRFGLIPKIRKHGINWTWADINNPQLSDFAEFSTFLVEKNINCDTYAFWMGKQAWTAVQTFIRAQGILNLNYTVFNPADCKTLKLDYCGFEYDGVKYVFYLERAFSDRNHFGGAGYDFGKKGIGIPMCDRSNECRENDEKMFTMVYFETQAGEIIDEVIDSNGWLNTRNGQTGRNTYGILCEKHVYGVKSWFGAEVHEPEKWVNLNSI